MIERIQSFDEFEKLQPQWNALLADSRSDCVFLTYEWLSCWWRHQHGGRRLNVLAVRSCEQLTAIAPLALRPRRLARLMPFRTLQFMGTGQTGADYLDVIARNGQEQAAGSELGVALARSRCVVEFGQTCPDSTVTGLADALGQRGWAAAVTSVNVCPFIPLAGRNWDDYLASLGAQHRYNFNRRLKNLNKQFEMRLELAADEPSARRALDILLELHNSRFGARSDAFHTQAIVEFHREFTTVALRRGWLRLFVLWLDGKPAAALYGLRYGPKFYFYQSGFDPAFARHSVGLVMMGMTIRHAIEDGAAEYDLLHGAEEYKFHWARTSRPLNRIELYPPSWRGLLYRKTADLARAGRRMARHMLPEYVANRIAAAGSGA